MEINSKQNENSVKDKQNKDNNEAVFDKKPTDASSNNYPPYYCADVKAWNKKHGLMWAFSLIELMISLIVVSCITAAFTPVITKKLKSGSLIAGSVGDAFRNSKMGLEDCKEFTGIDNCMFCDTKKKECKVCAGSACDNTHQYTISKNCSCGECSDKYPNCQKCTEQKCEQCKDGKLQQGTECVDCPSGKTCDGTSKTPQNPPSGYYAKDGIPFECSSAIANCKICSYNQTTSIVTCDRCSKNTYLKTDKKACVDCSSTQYCPEGTSQSSIKTCNQLTQNCSTCNADNCTKCSGTLRLKDNKCVTCDSGYTCDGSATQTQCTTAGYYCTNGQSFACSSKTGNTNCIDCNRADGTCTKCTLGTHKLTTSNTCTNCDTGYWCSDGINKDSNSCTTGCKVCATNSTCATCNNGYNKTASNTCCSTNCATCNNGSSTSCATCPNNNCKNTSTNVCYSNGSLNGCIECTDSNTCTKCPSGKYLKNKSCTNCPSYGCSAQGATSACPTANTYETNGKCCYVNCTNCSGSSSTQCTSCKGGYYLSGNECKQCPEGYKCAGGTADKVGCTNSWSSAGSTTCNLQCPSGYTCSGGSKNAAGIARCGEVGGCDGDTGGTYAAYWTSGNCCDVSGCIANRWPWIKVTYLTGTANSANFAGLTTSGTYWRATSNTSCGGGTEYSNSGVPASYAKCMTTSSSGVSGWISFPNGWVNGVNCSWVWIRAIN